MKKKKPFSAKLDKKTIVHLKKIKLLRKKQETEQKKSRHDIERVKTWIKGFDGLVEGGIPKNFLVLITGGPGTGKTTFAMEFLIKGALKGENGVYVSLEDDSEKVERQFELFGWDIKKMESDNKLVIIQPTFYDFSKLKDIIQDQVTRSQAKRLVIDSISLLGLYFKDPFTVRRALLDLEKILRELQCTTIVISESSKEWSKFFPFEVEEFIADGIIELVLSEKNRAFKRAIAIRKMRLTNHSLKIHTIKIDKKEGLIIE